MGILNIELSEFDTLEELKDTLNKELGEYILTDSPEQAERVCGTNLDLRVFWYRKYTNTYVLHETIID